MPDVTAVWCPVCAQPQPRLAADLGRPGFLVSSREVPLVVCYRLACAHNVHTPPGIADNGVVTSEYARPCDCPPA